MSVKGEGELPTAALNYNPDDMNIKKHKNFVHEIKDSKLNGWDKEVRREGRM